MNVPAGNQKFCELLERWRNTSDAETRKRLEEQVCNLCSSEKKDCERCIVGASGANYDGFSKAAPGGGIHGTEIFQDKDGIYHYSHPYQGD